eukprot:1070176-Pyramimonas_sp.AAC.1
MTPPSTFLASVPPAVNGNLRRGRSVDVGQELMVRDLKQEFVLASKPLQPHGSSPNPVMSRQVERNCGVELARLGA